MHLWEIDTAADGAPKLVAEAAEHRGGDVERQQRVRRQERVEETGAEAEAGVGTGMGRAVGWVATAAEACTQPPELGRRIGHLSGPLTEWANQVSSQGMARTSVTPTGASSDDSARAKGRFAAQRRRSRRASKAIVGANDG